MNHLLFTLLNSELQIHSKLNIVTVDSNSYPRLGVDTRLRILNSPRPKFLTLLPLLHRKRREPEKVRQRMLWLTGEAAAGLAAVLRSGRWQTFRLCEACLGRKGATTRGRASLFVQQRLPVHLIAGRRRERHFQCALSVLAELKAARLLPARRQERPDPASERLQCVLLGRLGRLTGAGGDTRLRVVSRFLGQRRRGLTLLGEPRELRSVNGAATVQNSFRFAGDAIGGIARALVENAFVEGVQRPVHVNLVQSVRGSVLCFLLMFHAFGSIAAHLELEVLGSAVAHGSQLRVRLDRLRLERTLSLFERDVRQRVLHVGHDCQEFDLLQRSVLLR